MPTLQIRNLPEDLHRELAESARREGRSLTQEAVVVLRRGLEQLAEDPRERRRRLFKEWAARPIEIKGEMIPPEVIIREDRER